MPTALVNGRVLRDDGFAQGLAVLIDADRITALVSATDARAVGVYRAAIRTPPSAC